MPFQAIPGNAMQCHAILSIPVELLLLNTRVDVQLIMPRAFEINTLINWFNRLWKKKCYRGRFNRWLIVGDGEFVTCFMMDDGNFRFLCGDAGSTLISLINRYLSECVAWIHPPASIDDEDDEEREKERKRERGAGEEEMEERKWFKRRKWVERNNNNKIKLSIPNLKVGGGAVFLWYACLWAAAMQMTVN